MKGENKSNTKEKIDFPTRDTVRNVNQICEIVKGTGSSN